MPTEATSVDSLLAEMAREGQALTVGPRGGTTRARPPKIRYTHEAMIDLIVQDPTISQNAIAEVFGYSTGWVSTVFTSDAFKTQLERRKAEIIDPVLQMSLKERIEALTTQSLKVLMEKLAKPADQVADGLALKAVELGMKAAGFGGQTTQQQVVIVDSNRIENLKHRLLALQGRGAQVDVIDG
jgi:hypothetical protein